MYTVENTLPLTSLVNYTTLPTSASNETYIVQTDVPDSIAFLIKNNVLVEFSFPPDDHIVQQG